MLNEYVNKYVSDKEENIDDSKVSSENGIGSITLSIDDLNSSLSSLDDI